MKKKFTLINFFYQSRSIAPGIYLVLPGTCENFNQIVHLDGT